MSLDDFYDKFKDVLYDHFDDIVEDFKGAIYNKFDEYLDEAKDRLIERLVLEGKAVYRSGKLIFLED